MKGGLVELPAGTPDRGNYRAMLRAADHGKPLITSVSGFGSPIIQRIEDDTRKNPIPDDLLGFLEGIPASYVLVHDAWLDPEVRAAYRVWLDRALESGRLVFVDRFDGAARNDLFAVAKNEPSARPLARLPWAVSDALTPEGRPWREDPSLLGAVDDPPEAAVVRGTLAVRGWARIPGEDLSVTIFVDGERRPARTDVRTPRLEVCEALPRLGPDCSAAGYEATFAFTPGDAGPHEIVARFRSKEGGERHYPVRRFTWKP